MLRFQVAAARAVVGSTVLVDNWLLLREGMRARRRRLCVVTFEACTKSPLMRSEMVSS